MKSRNWLKSLINGFGVVGGIAALLPGTTTFAQNAVLGPPSPPATLAKQPIIRASGSMQPKAVEQPGKQPIPEPIPEPKLEQILNALPAPALEPGEEGLVISLPAALRLANVRAWDITIATQQLQIAVDQRLGADVLWLPTLLAGSDYQYHSGPTQDASGVLVNTSRDSLYAGGAPLAIFALTDAIFTPLAARQVVRAQEANIQTLRNDTLTDLASVYFDLLEAEADLASIVDVDRRTESLVKKVESLTANGLTPAVEVARARATKANVEQIVETARQRWRNASAEVARIARLKPTVVLQPLEPPHVRMTLVPPTMSPDELIPIAMASRPELTFFEAQARAVRERQRQEKWRPFLPTIIARGGGSTPPYPMAIGGYGGGPGSGINGLTQRSDWDLSAIWTLQNLGAGNVALIRERRHDYDLARSREFRFADVVAREVTVAWSDVRSADRRVAQVERELRQAELSASQNLQGLGEVKNIVAKVATPILVIRPQEVVQSLQELNQAYFNYYAVVAEYNRAQFRMYRALGSPAQLLEGHDGLNGPLLKNAPKK